MESMRGGAKECGYPGILRSVRMRRSIPSHRSTSSEGKQLAQFISIYTIDIMRIPFHVALLLRLVATSSVACCMYIIAHVYFASISYPYSTRLLCTLLTSYQGLFGELWNPLTLYAMLVMIYRDGA